MIGMPKTAGLTTATRARHARRSRRLSPRNRRSRRDRGHSGTVRSHGCRQPRQRLANPLRRARREQCGSHAEADQSSWNEPGTRVRAFALDDRAELPDPAAEQDRGSARAEPVEHIAQRRGRGTQLAGENEVSGQGLDSALQAFAAIVEAADLPPLLPEEIGDDKPFVAQFSQLLLLLAAALQQILDLSLLELIALAYLG